MAKYKVLVIAHCLKNNKIASHGDIVDETQLTTSANELESAGFIEKFDETSVIKEVTKNKKKVNETSVVDDMEVNSEVKE